MGTSGDGILARFGGRHCCEYWRAFSARERNDPAGENDYNYDTNQSDTTAAAWTKKFPSTMSNGHAYGFSDSESTQILQTLDEELDF